MTVERFPADLDPAALSADAVVIGDTVYATVIPVGSDGEVAGEDIRAQSTVAFELLREVLEGAGSDLDELAHLTIYLTDIARDRGGFNEVYRAFVSGPVPVRCAVGVAALARPYMLVELTAVAARRK